MIQLQPERAVDKKKSEKVLPASWFEATVNFTIILLACSITSFSQLSWHQATAPSFFTIRGGHRMLAHDNKLFIFSGQSETQSVSTNSFCTHDGTNWTLLADTVGFRRSAYYGCVSFNGYIWITGGIKIEEG